jgi:hypothetical protein
VKHGEKVSIMNHVEAGKKHVADLLVSERDIEDEVTSGKQELGHSFCSGGGTMQGGQVAIGTTGAL